MAFEDNKAIVVDFVTRINRGDKSAVNHFISPNFYSYKPRAGEKTAQEVVGKLIGDFMRAAPDLSVEVGNFVPDGEDIQFDMTVTGTQTGELWGAPPSGNKVAWNSTVAGYFENGQLAFYWPDLPVPEILGVLRQLGLIPPPDKMDQPLDYPVVLDEFLVKLLFTGQAADKECSHLDLIQVTEPSTDVCETCVEMGDIWPALRMCLICGFIGCCDTSKNKHMKAHYEETGHPIFRSIRLDEGWIWCYEDDAFFTSDVLENYRS